MTRESEPVLHEHVHNWIGGERRFRHAHSWPTRAADPNRARPHQHLNGSHSHPHGHADYEVTR